MSALGATDWFTAGNGSESEPLVCGIYPLSFVEEIRAKVGSAAFFGQPPSTLGSAFHFQFHFHRAKDFPPGLKAVAKDCNRWPRGSLGTMMPFNPFVDSDDTPVFGEEHGTLKSWSIEKDGWVRISQVGLVEEIAPAVEYDSIHDDKYGFMCTIYGPMPDSGKSYRDMEYDKARMDFQSGISLNTWLQSYLPEMPNYALCTRTSSKTVDGIILKELEPGELIKVGTFMIESRRAVISLKTVNWTVL